MLQTLVAGQDASLTLGIDITDVSSSRPLTVQIGALAPGFTLALATNYPDQPKVSMDYKIPIAADAAGAKEMTLTVGMLSAHVIYHYEATG